MEPDRFYVYVWIRSDTMRPFYVGKGSGDRFRRKGKNRRSEYFNRICSKYQCFPLILFDHLLEQESFDLEVETIRCLREKGYQLANMCDGGQGSSGRVITDEYRAKYSEMNKGENNPNYGNRWTVQQKQHLSEVRKTNKIAALGNNPRALPVMCVETGKVYGCQQEATSELGLKSMVSINHALKERRFTAKGFHFVCGEMIDELDTPTKRQEYLREVEFEKVALHSNV